MDDFAKAKNGAVSVVKVNAGGVLEQFGKDREGHVVGTGLGEVEERPGGEVSDSLVPVVEFVLEEMVDDRLAVLGEFGDELGEVKVAVVQLAYSEVIAFGEDVNAVRELTLSADVFFMNLLSQKNGCISQGFFWL